MDQQIPNSKDQTPTPPPSSRGKAAASFMVTRILGGASLLFAIFGIGMIIIGAVGAGQDSDSWSGIAAVIGAGLIILALGIMIVALIVNWLLAPKKKP